MSKIRLLLTTAAFVLCAIAFQLQTAPAAAAAAPAEAGAVINFAANQIDKPYKLGADGMRSENPSLAPGACSPTGSLSTRSQRNCGSLATSSGSQRCVHAWSKREGV